MNKYINVLISTALLTSNLAFAEVGNGDFESWSGNTPDDWTTIDSGINVSESTGIVHGGSSSASINITTASQASTDFRQSVSVIAGETYDFSVWIYHTEGNVRARLYVDGYQGYSDESSTNQWQQLSYSYSPSSSGEIDVGLRFYDTSGFDGAEIVYVDDFSPTTSTASSGSGSSGSTSCTAGSLNLTTDNYGSETSWEITDSSSAVVSSGSDYASNTIYSEAVCLNEGTYTFTINDTFGDGICCSFGSGSYSLSIGNNEVASGGEFTSSEATSFTVNSDNTNTGSNGDDSGTNTDLSAYYTNAQGLSGYTLKTALYNIIKGHSAQSYGDIWTFASTSELDKYYENDGSILDIYSESPGGNDSYNYTPISNQCGNFSGEATCYNREHAFPRSWFGGAVSPMNTDVHHVFATDGYVNGQRSSFPYGEVSSASFTSRNGSLLGSGTSAQGYTGTVFEPIDAFKGDLARAYFYMATRYESDIDSWESNSTSADVVLNGTENQVFESWFLALLKKWHDQDPVSQKELDRNEAAYSHQGNRNPFIDNPQFVSSIWGD